MECKACGYEYEKSLFKGKNKGEQEFYKIEGNFTISIPYGTQEVQLRACPECNTVKMERMW